MTKRTREGWGFVGAFIVLLVFVWWTVIQGHAQGCVTVQPAAGWECLGGNWLPPGHPALQPTAPVTTDFASLNPFQFPIREGFGLDLTGGGSFFTNEQLQEYARTGEPLPNQIIWFNAPLRLTNPVRFVGGGKTALVGINNVPGAQIIIESTLDNPWRGKVEKLLVICVGQNQNGVMVNGHNMVLEGLQIWSCTEGLSFPGLAVNIAVRDSQINGNTTGVVIMGHGPSAAWGNNSITTLRFSGVRISGAQWGVRIGHGIGVVFDDSSIIEGNPGVGVLATPTFLGSQCSMVMRDVWFELNGQDVVDQMGCVRFEGITGRH